MFSVNKAMRNFQFRIFYSVALGDLIKTPVKALRNFWFRSSDPSTLVT